MSIPEQPAQARLDELQRAMRTCRRCQEQGFPAEGPAVFSGPATARLMVVGQAPARIDLTHRSQPWSGTGGRRLMAWLEQAGFEEATLRKSHYLTALTRCFPGKHPSGKGDRPPTRAEQQLCLPYLVSEIGLLQPRVIVTVGGMAAARFLGKQKLADIVGSAHNPAAGALKGVSLTGTWVVPLPHPSGASLWLNTPAHLALVERALAKLSELRQEYRL